MKTWILAPLALAAALGGVRAAAPAAAPAKNTPDFFTADYKDTPAASVLLEIARNAHKSVVIPSDLEGNVTAHFQRTPSMQAFGYVANLANADYRIMDDTITVVKRSVVIRPRAEQSAAPAENAVERAARRIDEEDDGLYPTRAPRRVARQQPSVRVETYVNIQSAPAYPQPYPVFGGYPAYRPYGYGPGIISAPYGSANTTRFYSFGGNVVAAPYGDANTTRFYPAW
ncbi:MAG TPA: hypothetical protein VGM37_16600 [Armatimonadota bacterium]|jgi:hypothetical protein